VKQNIVIYVLFVSTSIIRVSTRRIVESNIRLRGRTSIEGW